MCIDKWDDHVERKVGSIPRSTPFPHERANACARACVRTCVHGCVCARARTRVRAFACVCALRALHACACAFRSCVRACMCVHTFLCARVHAHMHVCVSTRSPARAFMRACMRTVSTNAHTRSRGEVVLSSRSIECCKAHSTCCMHKLTHNTHAAYMQHTSHTHI